MGHFYFHLCTGPDVLIDFEGQDLCRQQVAEVALYEARAIISAEALDGHIRLDQHLRVEDAQGRIVLVLPFVEAVEIVRPV